ncbi:autotransporter outer membrane beta-barrel domain-containing protein [Ascidiaceihabitans sp.]|uniref:autotransporter outer membrane beta-barrel domain-containing protein n=1 Tax=Ascidiaceihabitans sp. TaxID=1872644 RepID=UPI003299B9B5
MQHISLAKAHGISAHIRAFFLMILMLAGGAGAAMAQVLPSVTLSPNTIAPNGTSQMTITLSNSGSSGARELAFTLPLPSNVTLSSTAVSDCANATLSGALGTNTISFSGGQLPGFTSCTVQASLTSSVINSYTIPAFNLSSDIGITTSSSVGFTVANSTASFSKSFSPSTINAGETTRLTYLIDNTLQVNGVGVLSFNETLPNGMTISDTPLLESTCGNATFPATVTADPGGSSVSLFANGFLPTFPALDAGASCVLAFNVSAPNPGSYVATSGSLSAGGANLGPSTATLNVVRSDLQILKTYAGIAVPDSLSRVTYTISNNSRPDDVTAIAFSDDFSTLSPALAGAAVNGLVSHDCGGTPVLNGIQEFQYSGGTLATGASCTVVIDLYVPASAAPDTYTNQTADVTGLLSGAPVSGSGSTATLTVQGGAAPTVATSFTDAARGGTTDYVITITNPSSATSITDIAFRTELRSGIVLTSANSTPVAGACGAGSSFTFINGSNPPAPNDAAPAVFSMSGGSLGPSASCTLTVTLPIPADAKSGSYSFTSEATTATSGGSTVAVPASTAALVVTGDANLTFAKSFESGTAPGGTANLVFDLAAGAENPVTATNITFSDDLSAMLAGATANIGSASNSCGGNLTGSAGDTLISLTGASLAPGANCQITVPVSVPAAAASGTYTNTTSALTASDGTTTVTFPAASADLTVSSISIDLAISSTPVLPGSLVPAIVTLTNDDPSNAATSALFTWNVSSALSGLAAENIAAASNTCGGSLSGTTFVIFSGGTINAGSSCQIDIMLRVPAGAAEGDYGTTTGNVQASVNGASVIGNTASSRLFVETTALNVTKNFAAASVAAGGTVEVSITIENTNTTTAATGISISDNLSNFIPGALRDNGGTTNLSGCGGGGIAASDTVNITPNSIAAGGTCTILFDVIIPAGTTPAEYTNTTSTVSGTIGGVAISGPAASASILVFSADAPSFVKSIAPNPVNAVDTTVITYTINNPVGGASLSSMGFSDDITTNLGGATVNALPGANACGAGSSVSGSGVIQLTSGALAAGENCSFDVTVNIPASAAGGSFTSTTSDLVANGLTVTNGATASLSVNDLPPTFAKAFAPASITQGGASVLTYTIDNSVAASAATALSFADSMPTGVTLTTLASNTCGGTPVPAGDNASLAFSGGSVGAGASCVISYNVTSTTIGANGSTTGLLSTSHGTSAGASASLTVTAAPVPTLAKAFAPASIAQGDITRVTFTADNSASFLDAAAFAFTDNLPAGMAIAPTPGITNTCVGGTATAVAGSGSFAYSGGTIAAGTTCALGVNVRAITAGGLVNTTTAPTSSLGTSLAATDTLTVTTAPAPTVVTSFSPTTVDQGDPSVLTVTYSNSSLLEMTGGASTTSLPANLVISSTAAAPSTTCSGASLVAVGGGSSFALSGVTLAPSTSCQVTGTVVTGAATTFNVTGGDLTSANLPTGTSTAASLTATAPTPPVFAAAASPSTFVQGAETTIVYTITNTDNALAAGNLAFSKTMPAGATIGTGSTAATTCTGGTLIAAAGATSFSLSGATAPARGSCTVTIPLKSITAGAASIAAGDLTSDFGNSGAGAVGFTVTAAPLPTYTMVLNPTSIAQGAESRMTLTVTNVSLVDATGFASSLIFPAGVSFSSTPDGTDNCANGSGTPVAGGASLAISALAAAEVCSVSFDIVGTNLGDTLVSTGVLTSSLGTTAAASATLNVTAAGAPAVSAAFNPATVIEGNASTLTVTIDNSANFVEANTGAFSTTLPSNLIVATPANAGGSCTGAGVTGTVQATDGGTTIGLSGATIAAGGSCTYTYDLQAMVDGTDNLSVNFTSNLAASGSALAALITQAAPLPTLAAVYAPATITQGNVSTLTYTLDNSTSLIAVTGGAFSQSLPANVVIADTPNLATTCSAGSPTGTAGGSAVTGSGLTIGASSSCTVSVDVTSDQIGVATATSSVLSTNAGDSAAGATASLTVTAAPVLTFAKVYAPAAITQGQTSTATYTITNPAGIEATAVSFFDTLPTGVGVADTPNASTTCGGTVVATGASISLSGATIAAGASCTITGDVTSMTVASTNQATGDLTSSLGNSSTATAALDVTAAPAPLFTGVFAPATITQGETSTLTYTIDHLASSIDATGLKFDVTLPAGMTVAATPNASTTCAGGGFLTSAGASAFGFLGGTVAELATCEVSIDVTAVTVGTQNLTTGDLTSDLGNSGTATAALDVTAAPVPVFTKAFAAASINQGDVTTLTLTVDASTSFIDVEGVTFADPLPSGMTVASTPNAATTCAAGTVTATAGASSITFAGGTVSAATSCDIRVDVTASATGTYNNVTGLLGSDLGSSAAATASIDVLAAAAPAFSKGYVPSTITESGTSRLAYAIDNTANIEATGLAFTDLLPAGVTVASPSNASTTCSAGSISASGGSISFSAGTVDAATTCAISVDVTSGTVGTVNGASGDLTSSLGNSGPAAAALTVEAATVPLFNQEYQPPQIVQGAVTNLVFTVDNSGNAITVGSLGFTANLPAGLTVAGGGARSVIGMNASSSCGGTVTATVGASSASFAGGSIAPGTTCAVSIPLTSTNIGTPGAVSATLTSSVGSVAASAPTTPLVVVVNPDGNVTFVQNSDDDGTFTFTSTVASLNTSITTSGGTGSVGPLDVPVGTYTVTQTRPSGFSNTALSCSDSDSTVDVATGALTLVVGPNEAITCTYTSSNTTAQTVEVISDFLARRNNLILSNGPSSGRRMDRLNQGIGTSETLAFQRGDLKAINPVNFNLLSLGSGSYSLSTSLAQAERAAVMFQLASDGDDTYTTTLKNRRFDVWFEASYNEFDGSNGSGGHFGIAYVGADYLFSEDLLAGFLVQYDTMEDNGATSSISGTGWMVGPYLTKRLAPNLVLDGRLAYGRSTNDISPFNTYTDKFDTERFLIDVSLSGNYEWGDWTVAPNVGLSYIEDTSDAYIDSNNNLVPSVKESLGQLKFGPTFSTSYVARNNLQVQPSFTINGIYNFGQKTQATGGIADGAEETDGFRARIEAGVKLTNRYGTRVELGANYDGIGKSDFEAWGVKAQITIPIGRK